MQQKMRPLESYRVLDLTDEKGLMCGKLLADLGADVIKIERPGGDSARSIAPFYKNIPDPGKSLHWFAFNAGKRGITLDIESRTGREVLKKLVKTSDFLVESFPPGYLHGLGLGYDVLRELNPRLICTSIRLFGDSGPYKGFAGTDFTMFAASGLMHSTGDPDRAPVAPAVPQSYLHAGAQAAAGTMIAHYSRLKSGRGQQLTVSVQAAVSVFNPFFRYLWEFLHQVAPRDSRLRLGRGVYFRIVWPCRDGYVAFRLFTGATTHSKRMYPFVQCLKDEGIAGGLVDVRWEKEDVMKLSQDIVDGWEVIVGTFFKRHTKAELFALSRQYDFMFLLPISTAEDILKDPQLTFRSFFTEITHEELGTSLKYPGAFCHTTAYETGPRSRAPLIGEHNSEVYAGLGFSTEQILGLKQAGII